MNQNKKLARCNYIIPHFIQKSVSISITNFRPQRFPNIYDFPLVPTRNFATRETGFCASTVADL
jgi:hypothetical protein